MSVLLFIVLFEPGFTTELKDKLRPAATKNLCQVQCIGMEKYFAKQLGYYLKIQNRS